MSPSLPREQGLGQGLALGPSGNTRVHMCEPCSQPCLHTRALAPHALAAHARNPTQARLHTGHTVCLRPDAQLDTGTCSHASARTVAHTHLGLHTQP